ncbi:hypothetical protein GCM10007205_09730 [Oxalicibacterium flavum]|uniref:Uncharacterized protein n=1 Tax=Oxalicibacterium flavum TaxID=179467 RepID=A0A8J2ULL1_9BURK|nr:hypothetical protein GCM10007205_09730 [Oxalicibacterium flavum]
MQARSAFEASLYIQLVLKKDPIRRARIYMVGECRRHRAFAISVLDDSKVSGSFNAKAGARRCPRQVRRIAGVAELAAQPGKKPAVMFAVERLDGVMAGMGERHEGNEKRK